MESVPVEELLIVDGVVVPRWTGKGLLTAVVQHRGQVVVAGWDTAMLPQNLLDGLVNAVSLVVECKLVGR